VVEIPSLTAVIQKGEAWYVSTCPELGVASQGKTRKEAYAMLVEAVELWLQAPSAKEIKRRVKLGGSVQPLSNRPMPKLRPLSANEVGRLYGLNPTHRS
jgi:predicted RNase H-like HicB family nuclease